MTTKMVMSIKNNKKLSSGFTLIEMLVALSLFSIIMTIMMGSVLSVISANRKSQSMRSVMDNLNFTLDDMARTIRFGTNYHCGASGDTSTPSPKDCDDNAVGENNITFKASDGRVITYKLVNGQIARSIVSVNGGADYFMTSGDIFISKLTFFVFGTTPFPDEVQPEVILIVAGSVGSKPSEVSSFSVETTVVQRYLDFQ